MDGKTVYPPAKKKSCTPQRAPLGPPAPFGGYRCPHYRVRPFDVRRNATCAGCPNELVCIRLQDEEESSGRDDTPHHDPAQAAHGVGSDRHQRADGHRERAGSGIAAPSSRFGDDHATDPGAETESQDASVAAEPSASVHLQLAHEGGSPSAILAHEFDGPHLLSRIMTRMAEEGDEPLEPTTEERCKVCLLPTAPIASPEHALHVCMGEGQGTVSSLLPSPLRKPAKGKKVLVDLETYRDHYQLAAHEGLWEAKTTEGEPTPTAPPTTTFGAKEVQGDSPEDNTRDTLTSNTTTAEPPGGYDHNQHPASRGAPGELVNPASSAEGEEGTSSPFRRTMGAPSKKPGTSLAILGQRAQLPVVLPTGELNLAAIRTIIPRVECDVCQMGDYCPAFKPRSVCSFNSLWDGFDNRSVEGIMASMEALVEFDHVRTMMAMLQERMSTGGRIDPRVTAQMDSYQRRLSALLALKTPRATPTTTAGNAKVTLSYDGPAPQAPLPGKSPGGGIMASLFARPVDVMSIEED